MQLQRWLGIVVPALRSFRTAISRVEVELSKRKVDLITSTSGKWNTCYDSTSLWSYGNIQMRLQLCFPDYHLSRRLLHCTAIPPHALVLQQLMAMTRVCWKISTIYLSRLLSTYVCTFYSVYRRFFNNGCGSIAWAMTIDQLAFHRWLRFFD